MFFQCMSELYKRFPERKVVRDHFWHPESAGARSVDLVGAHGARWGVPAKNFGIFWANVH